MRNHSDWLQAYMDYASFGEAPLHMHFWCGVSALAGALKRKVWIDQTYFRWYPNFYIIVVAPPGIVAKSTTSSIAHGLLRQVPDTPYGPDIVTWPSLVGSFELAQDSFEIDGERHVMSALTLESSEFGNLFDPQDREMVDLYVTLWDGKQGAFKKETKSSGNNSVENPWINLVACTTPAWIAGNFPDYLIGGGFTSRCIFVYAEKKRKLVAYPENIDVKEMEQKLVEDLCHISTSLLGEYRLTPEAKEWGTHWYEEHNKAAHAHLDKERFGGYLARKQTHMHKLAMILAASSGDAMEITLEHLQTARIMVSDLEPDMIKVFSKIGKSENSVHADKLIAVLEARGPMSYGEVYRYMHTSFPSAKDFEDILAGCIKAGFLKLTATPEGGVVSFVKPKIEPDLELVQTSPPSSQAL